MERFFISNNFNKKVLEYANKYNTKAHILHVSTADEMSLLTKQREKYNC